VSSSSSGGEEGEEEGEGGSDDWDSDEGALEASDGAPGGGLSQDLREWGVGALAANPEEQVPLVEATRRLAVVDLDWGAVRAVDILAVLRSFLPKVRRGARLWLAPHRPAPPRNAPLDCMLRLKLRVERVKRAEGPAHELARGWQGSLTRKLG
jgi:hypothetical protein